MARRRYVRDNRGRFASTGATSRGGRLKTASGKKRETQTMKASGAAAPGTIGKNKSTKLKPQQVRDLQSKSRQLKASASRNSARMGNTGSSPAQQAKFAKAAAADRKAAAAIDKKLKGQAAPPNVMAKSARLGGEGIGGRYKGKGKTSLYGKDLSKTKAARPSGTIGKPKGLKPGTIKPKPAAARQKTSDAEKTIKAAQRRLKTKQYGYTANQSQALAIDRRLSKMTPMQLAQSRVRGAKADVQRTRRSLRAGINENAPASWKSRMTRSLQERKREFEKAAKDYRILKPKRRRR